MNLYPIISAFIPPYFHIWHLPIVFLAGLIGEGYGTVIGSGGILTQFVLASLGVPLPNVVATDIAGAQGVNLGVLTVSSRTIWSNKNLLILLVLPLFLGGLIGTIFLVHIPLVILKYILIVGLTALLIYMFLGKQKTIKDPENIQIKFRQYPFLFAIMFVLGIYSNVSGVGVGTFQKLAFAGLLRLSFIDSLGLISIISIPAGIFSFITTAIFGLIAWPYLLTLWLGTFLGGRYMAKHIRKISNTYLNVVLITIAGVYLIYLLVSIV